MLDIEDYERDRAEKKAINEAAGGRGGSQRRRRLAQFGRTKSTCGGVNYAEITNQPIGCNGFKRNS